MESVVPAPSESITVRASVGWSPASSASVSVSTLEIVYNHTPVASVKVHAPYVPVKD